METNQHLFKELEAAERLFSDGSIKNAQKRLRNVLKESKSLDKIPNKLRHKINAAISKSRYFDEISSFATNPKRNDLINKLDDLIKNPNNNPRKHAHKIHEIHTQWQLLDLSSKPASKSQWLNFNDLTKKAWEPCKEYFDEIKQIKVKNASKRNEIINDINKFVNDHLFELSLTNLLISLIISFLFEAFLTLICFISSKYSLQGSHAFLVRSLKFSHCDFDAGLLDRSNNCH